MQAAVQQPQWAPDGAPVLYERHHHHDHDYHHDDCASDEQAVCGSVTGRVMTLRYDHFGDSPDWSSKRSTMASAGRVM